MSIIRQGETERFHAHRTRRLWDLIQRDWAGTDSRRWKTLACIHLRLHCGWRLEQIARVFNHTRGHILRLINDGLQQLQQTYARPRGEHEDPPGVAPLAKLFDPDSTELQRRIDSCREELDIWQRLADQQTHRQLWGEPERPLQIIPGTLRERITGCLDNGPARSSSQIARELRAAASRVRRVLWTCPEFVFDAEGKWSVCRFDGQESIGVNVGPAPGS